MASLRRNRAIGADGPSPKFLYAILKQLDLKPIDWNEVASQLGISNGHAARMRYSRFKQQMEGIQPIRRNPRTAAGQKEKLAPKSRSKLNPEEMLNRDDSEEIKEEFGQPSVVRYEQAPAGYETLDPAYIDDKEWMSLQSHSYSENDCIDPSLENMDFNSTAEAFRTREEEPRMKTEPSLN